MNKDILKEILRMLVIINSEPDGIVKDSMLDYLSKYVIDELNNAPQ